MTSLETRSGEKKEQAGYGFLVDRIAGLLESARRASARAVNAVMTATYWEIGRRIVEFEQGGRRRAEYREQLLKRLSADLTARVGRGFSIDNLERFRLFYQRFPQSQISATPLRKSATGRAVTGNTIFQTPSEKCRRIARGSSPEELAVVFPLPWSAYIRLLSVQSEHARAFYEAEALRGGWSVRQLDRQISSMFYERTALSRNKVAMLRTGEKPQEEDKVTPEEELKDPVVLEFLGLKDEYSESELEEALIRHLESFLLELGGDFAFVGRQRRLRIGDEWYRMDLLFYHRRLRCLVVVELKTGKFTAADARQMQLYLNYVREHWTQPDENPPVGLILCAARDSWVAHYALEGLPNKVLAAEYRVHLPEERLLAAELTKTRRLLEGRRSRRALVRLVVIRVDSCSFVVRVCGHEAGHRHAQQAQAGGDPGHLQCPGPGDRERAGLSRRAGCGRGRGDV
jgi:predicted nuclease of restriction endonuclease-like (RecB) superfamily